MASKRWLGYWVVGSVLVVPGGLATARTARDDTAHHESADAGSLFQPLDALLTSTYKPQEPGAAAIVVKDGQTLLRKGYGLANVELGVPIQPEMVFRIGSVTKQFTSAAVLLLEQDGKLKRDDEITRFLPDYPTKGRHITIEHLLTHTSGIKPYTSLPEFWKTQALDATLEELIGAFKDQPMDFAPDEKYAYNNSGYVLLGAIIEKASGEKYADFVRKRIFEPLGMTRTAYESTGAITIGRVSGYGKDKDTIVNAPYLSMTKPFSAGSLTSTVDDLARWDASLYTEKLLTAASKERMWTAHRLANGESTKYGYGWAISEYEGHPIVAHGGGINGFVCHVMRLPQDRVYVAVLTNRAFPPGPDGIAKRLAAIAIGKPMKERTAITLKDPSILDRYVGRYQLRPDFVFTITREGDQLMVQGTGQSKDPLLAESETEFFLKVADSQISFVSENGSVTALVLHANGADRRCPRIP